VALGRTERLKLDERAMQYLDASASSKLATSTTVVPLLLFHAIASLS
jgi:hypothetical protein